MRFGSFEPWRPMRAITLAVAIRQHLAGGKDRTPACSSGGGDRRKLQVPVPEDDQSEEGAEVVPISDFPADNTA